LKAVLLFVLINLLHHDNGCYQSFLFKEAKDMTKKDLFNLILCLIRHKCFKEDNNGSKVF